MEMIVLSRCFMYGHPFVFKPVALQARDCPLYRLLLSAASTFLSSCVSGWTVLLHRVYRKLSFLSCLWRLCTPHQVICSLACLVFWAVLYPQVFVPFLCNFAVHFHHQELKHESSDSKCVHWQMVTNCIPTLKD